MEQRPARVLGEVHYREGDGPLMPVRPGPVRFAATTNDVTLSWEDGDTRGSAAVPLADFRRYVVDGLIVLDDGQPVP